MRVRRMEEADVTAVDRVLRLAFGTAFGLPDPLSFRGDAGMARVRWSIYPETAFVAEENGDIIGSIFGMDWGGVFIIGPLTVRPDHWNGGVARQLLNALLETRDARLFGLFTDPASPKHNRLYESYGFRPRRLTAVMSRALTGMAATPALTLFSQLTAIDRARALEDARGLTNEAFEGLDLAREIEGVVANDFGDVIIMRELGALSGFAICHHGAGSEAGGKVLFVKFAAVRPGDDAAFMSLIDAAEALATRVGAERIVAGVNTARTGAYEIMKDRGYRTMMFGVAMLRADAPGFNTPRHFVLDDWR